MNSKTIITLLIILILIAGVSTVVLTTYKNSHKNSFAAPSGPIASSSPLTAEASSTEPAPIHKNILITIDDNGKTVRMHVGDQFLLKLGAMQWTLSESNTVVAERIKNIATIKDAQGIFVAQQPGTLDLSAEGRPICKQGEMCAQYIVTFKVHIIVSN